MIVGGWDYIYSAYGITYGVLLGYGAWLAWRVAVSKRGGPHG